MRVRWKKSGENIKLSSYFKVFMFQMLLLIIIVQPILLTNINPGNGLKFINYLGIVIWLIGFYFEVIGDAQL